MEMFLECFKRTFCETFGSIEPTCESVWAKEPFSANPNKLQQHRSHLNEPVIKIQDNTDVSSDPRGGTSLIWSYLLAYPEAGN